MDCLNCDAPMNQLNKKGVLYEQCSTCGSAWLDQGEFKQLLKYSAPMWDDEMILARMQLPQHCRWCETLYPPFTDICVKCNGAIEHLCPQDKTPMFVIREGDIEIDICPTCKGMWFDCRELELLLNIDMTRTSDGCGAMDSKDLLLSAPTTCQICGELSEAMTFTQGSLRCHTCHEDIDVSRESTASGQASIKRPLFPKSMSKSQWGVTEHGASPVTNSVHIKRPGKTKNASMVTTISNFLFGS